MQAGEIRSFELILRGHLVPWSQNPGEQQLERGE